VQLPFPWTVAYSEYWGVKAGLEIAAFLMVAGASWPSKQVLDRASSWFRRMCMTACNIPYYAEYYMSHIG
jgi:hypothetical protein